MSSPTDVEAIRNEIARNVRQAMGDKGYVFGGYVRDHTAGIPFADMDVRVIGYSKAREMLSALIRQGYKLTSLARDAGSPYVGTHDKERWRVAAGGGNGPSVDIDLLYPKPGNESESPIDEYTIDANINALKMDYWGTISRAIPSVDAIEAVADIKKRQFKPLNDSGRFTSKKVKARWGMLSARGWQVKNANAASEKPSLTSLLEEKLGATKTSTGTEDKKMANKGMSGFADLMARSAKTGGYGAVAIQATKRTKQAMIALMKKNGADSATMMIAESLLETDGGTALIHMLLGMGCVYAPIPGMTDNKHVQALGEHFVQKGFETGFSAGADLLAEIIGPALAEALGAAEQLRVAEPAALTEGKRVAPITQDVSIDDMSDEEVQAMLERRKQARLSALGTHDQVAKPLPDEGV